MPIQCSPDKSCSFSGLLLVILFIPMALFGQKNDDTLTIDEAVRRALEYSHDLKGLAEQYKALVADSLGTRSIFYPEVSLDASYAFIGPKDNFTIKFGPTGFAMAPQNNIDTHLKTSMVLWDFGKRKLSMDMLGKDLQLLNANAALATRLIESKVTALVIEIAMLQKGVAIRRENIESLARHRDIVIKMVETGSSTEYEAVTVSAKQASARSLLLDAENTLYKKQITLSQVIGTLNGHVHPVNVSFDSTEYVPDIDSLIGVAGKNRTEIRIGREKLEKLSVQRDLLKKEMLPVLAASVSVGVKNGYPSDVDAVKPDWSAATALSIPVFDGGDVRHRRSALEHRFIAAQEELRKTVEQVNTEVMLAAQDVGTAYKKLGISQVQVAFSEQSLSIAEQKLIAGTITNNDVLDSQRDYFQAKMIHLQNQLQYTLSLYMLKTVEGVL